MEGNKDGLGKDEFSQVYLAIFLRGCLTGHLVWACFGSAKTFQYKKVKEKYPIVIPEVHIN